MHPRFIVALTTSCWLWAPHAQAQAAGARAAPCPQRWIYEPPPTTAYLAPPFLSDSAGYFFWWEETTPPELVAVRDGRTLWRRRLNAMSPLGPFVLNASLMKDDLLVVAYGSTIEGRRTSDGRIVWSRDLHADLAPELRKAGLAKHTELQTSAAARAGRALVTATAAGYSGAWPTATATDGKPLWRTRIAGAAARMVADGDRLYVLLSQDSTGMPIVAVDSNGKDVPPSPVPFHVSTALRGEEVVFDQEHVVTATIAPLPIKCPPNSPSCHPSPLFLTVSGFSGDQERWHFSHPVGLTWEHLLLLSDGSVLFVENQRVGRISPDGKLTPLCELPVDQRGYVAGLVHGDLVVAYHRSVGAYTIPGGPELAATGWVMRGGGPAQGWAARASAPVPEAPSVPFPAGVADPTAQVAYVQGDAGVTMALGLADGTVKWRTQSPARPVGIWHGRVVALRPLASAIQVAQLDPTNGAELATSQPIPLPDWVSPKLAPWGEPLMTDVRVESDRARLSWEVVINGGSGGATIRPYGASGLAAVDLRTGAVSLSPTKSLEGGKPLRPSVSLGPALLAGRQFTLSYAATATLTATDAKSGEQLWTRQLWSIVVPERVRVPPP